MARRSALCHVGVDVDRACGPGSCFNRSGNGGAATSPHLEVVCPCRGQRSCAFD